MREARTTFLRRALDTPELNVAVFSFLLHFVWEMQQMPFYEHPPDWTLWQMTQVYTCATFGDVGITLISFWTVALAARSRRWIIEPRTLQVVGFTAVGVAATIVLEYLATQVQHRWQYAEAMMTLPVLGTGLSPFLQWVVIPPLVAAFVGRQLR